jgi:hypothetical protein
MPEPVDQGPTVMKRSIVAAALLGALLPIVPASAAPGALAGAGAGPPSGGLCGGAVAVAVVGVNVADNVWQYNAIAVINPAGPCAIVVAAVVGAVGPWNPASGGCVGGPPTGSVCVGAVASALTPTSTTVTVCPEFLVGCVSAQATVTRV